MKLDKDTETELLEVSKVLRNCRRIEHRIYQLQKQLYLGHTTAYNMILKMVYPNYDEHKKMVREGFSSRPFKDSAKIKELEKDFGREETKPGPRTGSTG